MAKYKLLIKPSAVKEISEIPKRDRQRIINRISRLADDPRCEGCEKLSGHGQDRYRARQGRYRILYTISDDEVIVVVVKVGHPVAMSTVEARSRRNG